MINFTNMILSSTVVSTIILVFIKIRSEVIKYIVRERLAWRKELKEITDDITNSKNLKELKNAINKLKVRINPYGMCKDIVFYDSFFWKEITKLEKCNQLSGDEFKRSKDIFIDLISCLLKFDWERLKKEIKGDTQTIIVMISLSVCFVIYSILWFCNHTLETGTIVNYISFCTVYLIFDALSLLVLYWADKWKDRKQFIVYIILIVMFTIMMLMLSGNVLFPYFMLSSVMHWIVFLTPFLTLLYCVEYKVITYKQNVKNYIMSSMTIVGETKINIRYKVFFGKSDKFSSGKTVEFEKTNENFYAEEKMK